MFNEAKISDIFWREAIYKTVYIQNRGQLRVNIDKTPYELWKGIPEQSKTSIFLGKSYIERDDDDLGKLDSKTDEGIYLGYSSKKKGSICNNMRLNKILESTNVRVDDLRSKRVKLKENEQSEEMGCKEKEERNEEGKGEEEKEETPR